MIVSIKIIRDLQVNFIRNRFFNFNIFYYIILIIDAFVTIFKEEGIKGLYKGVIPALLLTSHGAIQVIKILIDVFYFYF